MNAEEAVVEVGGAGAEAATGADVAKARVLRKSPGIVSQTLINHLSLAERLVAVAQEPRHVAALDAEGVEVALVASLAQNAADCRAGIAHLADQRGTKTTATGTETDNRTLLLNSLQKAQTLAKLQQTLHPEQTMLKTRYLVGTSLRTLSRPALESAATQIIAHLKTDSFKGMPPAKIATLEAHLAAWRSADHTQGSAQSSAITTRKELLDRFEEVEKQRRALQLAADAAYPYTDSNNAGVRREFSLPINGPIKKT